MKELGVRRLSTACTSTFRLCESEYYERSLLLAPRGRINVLFIILLA